MAAIVAVMVAIPANVSVFLLVEYGATQMRRYGVLYGGWYGHGGTSARQCALPSVVVMHPLSDAFWMIGRAHYTGLEYLVGPALAEKRGRT